MTSATDNLYRFGLKLFAEPALSIDSRECIPIFHKWIQNENFDRLLIDVADYTHVVEGPKVVLIGHEGNLSLDTSEGRLGLVCTQKYPDGKTLTKRLTSVACTLISAAQLLASEPTFANQLHFRGSELQFFSNDRLLAPPGDSSVNDLKPAMEALMKSLYPGRNYSISQSNNGAGRLKMQLAVESQVELVDLHERVSTILEAE